MKIKYIILAIKIVMALWFCLLAYSAFSQTIIHVRHKSYEILYNQDLLTPECVYYTLQASDFSGSITKKPKYFKQDTQLPPPRRKDKAYRFTDYQRGHLCPSGDRDSRADWFKDTFYTSNIVPMTPQVNAGVWKEIENECRSLASQGHRLRIACGVIHSHGENVIHQQPDALHCDTLWKIAQCIDCDTIRKAWIVPNERYREASGNCITNEPVIYQKMTPIVAQFIRLWINR